MLLKRDNKKSQKKKLSNQDQKRKEQTSHTKKPPDPLLFMRALPWGQVEQTHHRTRDAAHRQPYWVVAS